MGEYSERFLLDINFARKKVENEEEILIPNGYSIIFINGLYLIVSTPYHYNIENATKFVDIYIGADSISLLNLVNIKNEDMARNNIEIYLIYVRVREFKD